MKANNLANILNYFEELDLNNKYWYTKTINETILYTDIDPYNDLTLEEESLIIRECKSNPIYFFRKVLRLNRISYPDNPDDVVNFKLTKNTLAKIYLELYKKISVMDLDPRQSYKTITSLAIMVYKYIFGTNENMYIIARYNEAAYNLNIIMRLISSLPHYIQDLVPHYNYKEKEMYNKISNNKINIIRVEYNNNFKKYSKSKSKTNYYSYLSDRIGKPTHLLFDDLCFHEDFKYVYKAFEIIIDVHHPIVDIASCAFKTKFIKDKWESLIHWNDLFYDTFDEEVSNNDNMILLHYEPDELFTKDDIVSLFVSLIRNINSISKNEAQMFRNELSIKPFDRYFRIQTYITNLRKYMMKKTL